MFFLWVWLISLWRGAAAGAVPMQPVARAAPAPAVAQVTSAAAFSLPCPSPHAPPPRPLAAV